MGTPQRVGRLRRLRAAAVLGSAGLVLVLTGCTSGKTTSAPSTTVQTRTVTSTTTPSVVPPTPISAGPTTAATSAACPLLAQQTAANKVGMRLDRTTVLRSGGKVVGCRFYALQHPNATCDATCFKGERLVTGPNQPTVEITTARYASTDAAHNAFILASHQGTNVQQDTITKNNIGLCFQIDFYRPDAGKDWACSFSVGTTSVLVKTVVTSPAASVVYAATEIAGKL